MASATSTPSFHRISALPIDCLALIINYAGPNAALLLLLTGNVAITRKVRRCGNLSLRWEQSAYTDWSPCKSLIESFNRLESLTLTTFAPHLLAKGRLSCALFPSSLLTLNLDFCGVFAALDAVNGFAPTLFRHCTQLLHLHLRDITTTVTIDLKHFPRFLRTLVLQSHLQHRQATYDPEDLSYLPPDLEKLHLNVLPVSPDSRRIIEIGENVPGELSSLIDLSIWVQHTSIATNLVGARLKRLEVHSVNGFTRHAPFPNVFESGNIAQCYPVLESLHCNQPVLWNAARFNTLPPSLTELVISAHASHLIKRPDDPEERAMLVKGGTNLRVIEYFDRSIPLSVETLSCFQKLESLGMNVVVLATTVHDLQILPQRLSQISVAFMSATQLQLLPPSLTSLKVTQISVEEAEKQLLSSLKPNSLLQGLSSLSTTSYLPIELALKMPSTLESLTYREGSSASLIAITQLSNEGHFPLLNYLSLTTPFKFASPTQSDTPMEDAWELSLAVVPRTLQTLIVSGYVKLSTRDDLGLKHHSRLTHLELLDKVMPKKLFQQLPDGLKTLHVNLYLPINLGDPAMCLEFRSLKTRLSALKELVLVNGSKFIVTPVSRLNKTVGLSYSEFWALPMPIKTFYLRSMIRIRLNQNTALWEDSYIFGISCLPRNLTTLTIPSTVHLWSKLVDTSSDPSIRSTILAAIKYHLPLLALPIINVGMNSKRQSLIEALPPHVCKLSIGAGSKNVLPFCHVTGFDSDEVYKANRGTYEVIEPVFHIINVISWLTFYILAPKYCLENLVLKAYFWNSLIGSGASLVVLLWKLHRRGLLAHHHLSAVKTPIRRSLALLSCFAPIISLLPWVVDSGALVWSYLPFFALIGFLLLSTLRNYIVFAVRYSVRFNP